MPVSLRRRVHCAHCHSACRVAPLEVMVRGGNGWQGHWLWSTIVVCPACLRPLLDALGQPRTLKEDDAELQALEDLPALA